MSVLDYVGDKTNGAGQKTVNAAHHDKAAVSMSVGFALAMRKMLDGWEMYALAHRQRYEDGIGKDGVLGDYWAEVGLAIKRLLDGEVGGWDCGSLSHNILALLDTEGIKHDGYTVQNS